MRAKSRKKSSCLAAPQLNLFVEGSRGEESRIRGESNMVDGLLMSCVCGVGRGETEGICNKESDDGERTSVMEYAVGSGTNSRKRNLIAIFPCLL